MTESFFTHEAAKAMTPQVEQIVSSLLDNIARKGCKDGPIDLMSELAEPLNPKVILQCIYKVSEKDVNNLITSNTSLGGTSGSASESGHTDLHEFMSKLVDDRMKKPGKPKDDLISKLAVEQCQKGKLDRDDMINLAFMVFVAGNTAITGSISLGVLTLLMHPEQLDALKKDPGLAGKAVEETLRFHTPSALNSRRVATTDVTLGGKVAQRT